MKFMTYKDARELSANIIKKAPDDADGRAYKEGAETILFIFNMVKECQDPEPEPAPKKTETKKAEPKKAKGKKKLVYNYKEKECTLCGKKYKPRYPAQKRCDACMAKQDTKSTAMALAGMA